MSEMNPRDLDRHINADDWIDEASDDDVCVHGVGFDEDCEKCEDDFDGDEFNARMTLQDAGYEGNL